MITSQIVSNVTEKVIDVLSENYVFPDNVEEIRKYVQRKQTKHLYDSASSIEELCEKLNEDLFTVSKDKHLRLIVRSAPTSDERLEYTYADWIRDSRIQGMKCNFGIDSVKIFEHNIGYVSIKQFYPAELAAQTAAHALGLLAHTRSLIIDLRHNGGGDPSMVAFLCSYFFANQVHINDLYWRRDDSVRQYWTLPYVPGKRMADTPVLILTSNHTFSAAEEFAYAMQHLGRAIVIGEPTAGGANPGQTFAINEYIEIFVPTGRAVNPITKSNWEGVGVVPDFEVPSNDALNFAKMHAVAVAEQADCGTIEYSI